MARNNATLGVDDSVFEDVPLTPAASFYKKEVATDDERTRFIRHSNAKASAGRTGDPDGDRVTESARSTIDTVIPELGMEGKHFVRLESSALNSLDAGDYSHSNAASPNASTRAILDHSRENVADIVEADDGDEESALLLPRATAGIIFDESNCDCAIRDRHALPPSIVARNTSYPATKIGSRHDAYLHMERMPRMAADEVLLLRNGSGHAASSAELEQLRDPGIAVRSDDVGVVGIAREFGGTRSGRRFQWGNRRQKQKRHLSASAGSLERRESKDKPRAKKMPSDGARRATTQWNGQGPFPSTSSGRRKTITTCQELRNSLENVAGSGQGDLAEWTDPALVERITKKSVDLATTTKRKASRSLSKTWENIGDLGKRTQKGFLSIFRKDSAVADRVPSAEFPFASGALPDPDQRSEVGEDKSNSSVDGHFANWPYLAPRIAPSDRTTSNVSPHYSLSSDLQSGLSETMEPLIRMKNPPTQDVRPRQLHEPVKPVSKVATEIESAMKDLKHADLAVTPPTADIRKQLEDLRSLNHRGAAYAIDKALRAGKFEQAKIQRYFDTISFDPDVAKARAASMAFREECAAEQQRLREAFQTSNSEGKPVDKIRKSSEKNASVVEGNCTPRMRAAAELAAIAGVIGNAVQGSGAPMIL